MTDSLAGKHAGTNPGSLAAVVLAAGEGRRLRPLTLRRPKPLCPVGNVALLDHALSRVGALGVPLAVNVHHGREQLERHLADRPDVHVSIEADRALGTAGALGHLREWLDGRDAVVVNADTWCAAVLSRHLDGLGPRAGAAGGRGRRPSFGPRTRVIASLLPWSAIRVASAKSRRTSTRPRGARRPPRERSTWWATTLRSSIAARPPRISPRTSTRRRSRAACCAGVVRSSRARPVDCVLGGDCVVDGVAAVVGAVASDVGRARGEQLERAIRVSSTMTVLVR